MYVIGLTGGIATGKSTVSALLAELGLPVVDADKLAREVVEPGQPALAEIRRAFGPGVIAPDGTLDRAALARLVFRDEGARRRLEGIIHPRVRERMRQILAGLASQGESLAVVDVPLLFEAGFDTDVDEVWVVSASEEEQLHRLMVRDGLSEEEARLRIEAQMPLVEKRARADRVIDNNGSPAATRRQVESLVRALRESRSFGSSREK